jgi:hypothetical protein
VVIDKLTDADGSLLFAVRPGRYCPPRQPTHIEPSFIVLIGSL